MPRITLTRDDGWFIITDEETGVTTQGESKLEALLMLADALALFEEDDVDLLRIAIDVFVPDPSDASLRTVQDGDGFFTDYEIDVEASIEDRFRQVATEVLDEDDADSADEELRERVAAHADAGKRWLEPPLSPDEIDAIEDDRLRALAWDLDATARAYNYASDPTLPDLAREEPSPWVAPEEQLRLELASKLLFDVYERLVERVGDDLRYHHRDLE